MNTEDYLKMVGNRVKQYRINMGYTQKEFADRSGISVSSICRLEQGSSIQLDTLIRILRAFQLDGNIELLIPDQTKRPSYHLQAHDKARQRVRKPTKQAEPFQWGDDPN